MIGGHGADAVERLQTQSLNHGLWKPRPIAVGRPYSIRTDAEGCQGTAPDANQMEKPAFGGLSGLPGMFAETGALELRTQPAVFPIFSSGRVSQIPSFLPPSSGRLTWNLIGRYRSSRSDEDPARRPSTSGSELIRQPSVAPWRPHSDPLAASPARGRSCTAWRASSLATARGSWRAEAPSPG